MSSFWHDWSDGKRWVMGVLSALIVTSVIAGVSFLRSKGLLGGHDLRATAAFGIFSLPPELTEHARAQEAALSADSIGTVLSELDTLARTYSDRDLLREVRYRLEGVIRDSRVGIPPSASRISGYWRFQIENASSQTLTDARLTVPWSTSAVIVRGDNLDVLGQATDTIMLGDLAPKERIVATVWTSNTPDKWDMDKVLLTHHSGFGSINFLYPAGRIGRIVDKCLGSPFTLLLILMLVAAWAILSIYRRAPSD